MGGGHCNEDEIEGELSVIYRNISNYLVNCKGR